MRKMLLILIILSSMILMAQERSYFEVAPIFTWSSGLNVNGQINFGFGFLANLMLGNKIALRPYFSFISYKKDFRYYWNEFNQGDIKETINVFGMGLRYYFDK